MKPKTEPVTFLEDLFKVTEPKSETFVVTLAPGFNATFRAIHDYTEYAKAKRRMETFEGEWPALLKTADWKPFLKVDLEAVRLAYYAAEICVNTLRLKVTKTQQGDEETVTSEWVEGTKLTMADLLSLSMKRANVFDSLKDQITAGQYAVVERNETEEVDEAKNE